MPSPWAVAQLTAWVTNHAAHAVWDFVGSLAWNATPAPAHLSLSLLLIERIAIAFITHR